MAEIKEVYQGYTVEYNEGCNKWRVMLPDGDFHREYDSLALAREAIDRREANKDKRKFEKVSAFKVSYGELKHVTITSVDYKGRVRYTYDDGERNTSYASDSFLLDNAKNTAVLKRLRDIQAERDRLVDEQSKLEKKAERFDPKPHMEE